MFLNNDVFLSLNFFLVLANSADPDEMQHYAAFHLGQHCLPNYPFSGLGGSSRPLVNSVYQKNIIFISQPKHMLWVLKRTVSMRQFF